MLANWHWIRVKLFSMENSGKFTGIGGVPQHSCWKVSDLKDCVSYRSRRWLEMDAGRGYGHQHQFHALEC